jgi:hypothetical protein
MLLLFLLIIKSVLISTYSIVMGPDWSRLVPIGFLVLMNNQTGRQSTTIDLLSAQWCGGVLEWSQSVLQP